MKDLKTLSDIDLRKLWMSLIPEDKDALLVYAEHNRRHMGEKVGFELLPGNLYRTKSKNRPAVPVGNGPFRTPAGISGYTKNAGLTTIPTGEIVMLINSNDGKFSIVDILWGEKILSISPFCLEKIVE